MNKESLLKLIRTPLDISHFILCNIIQSDNNHKELWKDSKLASLKNALLRKDLIYEINDICYITEKCKGYLDYINNILPVITEIPSIPKEDILNSFCDSVLIDIGDLIKEKTGKRILHLKSGKNFNCSKKELKERLIGFFKRYPNYTNLDNIKIAINQYLFDILSKKIQYPRRLIYFLYKEIEKNGKKIEVSEIQEYIDNIDLSLEKKQIYDGGFNL